VQRDQQEAQQFWLALLDAVRHVTRCKQRRGTAGSDTGLQRAAMADRVLSELAGARSSVTLVIDDLHELNSPKHSLS